MLGILLIGLVAGSIMLGITNIEKKLFEIRLKENAFEILRNYTNFIGSRIALKDIADIRRGSEKDIAIYKHEDENNIVTDVYTAKISVEELDAYCSKGCWDPEEETCHDLCYGKVFFLHTRIIWPNEADIQDTLEFLTYQIELR